MVRAVLEHRAAGADVPFGLLELAGFLDAEVRAGQVEMDVGRMAHRRHIPRSVPGSAHTEKFGQGRDLSGHRQPADLRDVDADEVDQPAAN